jgi:DeoR/GlpR family transcriptional regulator of sugar metabolism
MSTPNRPKSERRTAHLDRVPLTSPRAQPRAPVPAAARQQRIKALLAQEGYVGVTDIAERLGVSAMSVRRDLEALEQAGDLVRAHGAAMPAPAATDPHDVRYESRRRSAAAAKEAIAAMALKLGSTVLALARALAKGERARVFTNHLRVATALAGDRHVVYMPGGLVRAHEMSVCGAQAVAQVHEHWFDMCFLGASGLCAEGAFDHSHEDSEVKRAYIERSERVVLLCDASKFDRRSTIKFCSLDQIHQVVCDELPGEDLAAALHKAGVTVTHATTLAT